MKRAAERTHVAAAPEEVPTCCIPQAARPLIHASFRDDAVNVDVQHAGK